MRFTYPLFLSLLAGGPVLAQQATPSLDLAAFTRLQQELEDAYNASTLPDAPTNYAALDDFVLRVRAASDAARA